MHDAENQEDARDDGEVWEAPGGEAAHPADKDQRQESGDGEDLDALGDGVIQVEVAVGGDVGGDGEEGQDHQDNAPKELESIFLIYWSGIHGFTT